MTHQQSRQPLSARRRNHRPLRAILILALLTIGFPVHAERTVYISDQLKTIPVRAGQGAGYKIITFLAPGEPVIQLADTDTDAETSEWVRIRFARDKEGWILERYLSGQVPAVLQLETAQQRVAEMEKKVESLNSTNREYRRGNTDLLAEVKKLTGQVTQLSHDYETLRRDAAGFLELKAAHEQLTTRFSELQDAHRILREEHETLRQAYVIKWFLAGGAAVFLGILIGITLQSLRGRKKHTESLRFK
ncbi:MAG: TIGR04211 family SH3 domain-containing protein [Deltaproteobacteria bacterium]|nr:TIGR04211 family SH3 domain-containing protein [Candidatus Anaeroferrophillacea bacterium]